VGALDFQEVSRSLFGWWRRFHLHSSQIRVNGTVAPSQMVCCHALLFGGNATTVGFVPGQDTVRRRISRIAKFPRDDLFAVLGRVDRNESKSSLTEEPSNFQRYWILMVVQVCMVKRRTKKH
jgi:hypothetical protein